LRLARRSGLPLILDFRDHWSQWCHNANPTWLHYARKLRAERECILGASAVIGVTRQLVRDLQRAHREADPAKFHVLPNGFDADLAATPAAPRGPGEPFIIGYVGSFYYSPEMRASVMEPWWRKAPRHWLQYSPRQEDWLYRSPHFFFRALRQLLDGRPDLKGRVKVRFAGDRAEWLDQQVAAFGLQDVVEHLGRLPHRACLEFEAGCDALLVTSMKVAEGRDYCIAGKTFEYLATGRPILGIVTEGEQRDFLLSSGAALVANADDTGECAKAIERVIAGQFVPSPNMPFLQAFHRREMGRHMARVVGDVAGA
jgi:glycosyltransferase involved in cell wall biosynthesis